MHDLISRQAALDALRDYLIEKRCPDDGTLTCRLIENEVINKLPSALSTNLAEVGTDCISRQAAIDAINCDITITGRQNAELVAATIGAFVDRIKALPSAQPKRGKWIRDGHHIRCDQCGMYMCDTDREGDRIPTEFCPNCGSYNGGEEVTDG